MRSRFWIIPDRRDLTASGRRWLKRLVCRKAVQGYDRQTWSPRTGRGCLPPHRPVPVGNTAPADIKFNPHRETGRLGLDNAFYHLRVLCPQTKYFTSSEP